MTTNKNGSTARGPNKKKRVVVLGAGGQTGRTVLTRLGSEPSIIATGVCRNALTAAPLRAAGLDVRSGNVLDQAERARLIGDADVIVNLASASSLWGQARIEDRGVIDAIFDSTEARLIHFSSVAVYGTCVDPSRNTYERPRPDAPYGRDKLNLERYAERKRRHAGGSRRLVILRMGHVYGAEQWVSRFVLDRVNTAFRLPFDGALPSNAVHVANVAAAVAKLVRDDSVEGTFNLVDPGQSTWRQVFDWNTKTVGVAAVPGMSTAMSERLKEAFRTRAAMPVPVAIARDVTGWLKSLPMSLAGAAPSLRDLLLSTMSTLKYPALEQKILAVYGEMSVRRMTEPLPIKNETWLLSEAAPGPMVDFEPERDMPRERGMSAADALVRWYRGYSSPDSLFAEENGATAVATPTYS